MSSKKQSEKSFIKKSESIYGKKRFDYSNLNYKNAKSKVNLKCLIDNTSFQIIANSGHLRSSNKKTGGCPTCLTKLRAEEFINQAKNFWGEKYDYSKVRDSFINTNTKVLIGCPEHGFIPMVPKTHIHPRNNFKTGCPKCGREYANEYSTLFKRGSFEDFIISARKMHGDKFTYIKESWVDMSTKFKYKCPKHGIQTQYPWSHIKQQKGTNTGCKECRKDKLSKDFQLTFKEFTLRANSVHKNKYDYSQVIWKGAKIPIKVICPEDGHGAFYPVPSCHYLNKKKSKPTGCPACAGLRKLTNEEFIKRSKEVHGPDRYNYDLVKYLNSYTKVKISCRFKNHGVFEQDPLNHIHAGAGCPKCAKLFRQFDNIHVFKENKDYANSKCELYLVKVYDFLKIGISVNTLKRDDLYSEIYFRKGSTRVNVWCVEQKLLWDTEWARPSDLPPELITWDGQTELRYQDDFDIEDLKVIMRKELDYIEKCGWEKYSKQNLLPEQSYSYLNK